MNPLPESGKSKTGKRRTVIVERRVKALELRKAGWSLPAIAEELGYLNAGGAFKAVDAALKAVQREPAEAVRTMECERLDQLQRAVWPAALQGDDKAIGRVLDIMTRRATLLGLDKPPKMQLTGADGGPVRIVHEVHDYGTAAAILGILEAVGALPAGSGTLTQGDDAAVDAVYTAVPNAEAESLPAPRQP